jgi:hypothetical protein
MRAGEALRDGFYLDHIVIGPRCTASLDAADGAAASYFAKAAILGPSPAWRKYIFSVPAS